ncbi:MAG: hypothetical protein J6W14_06400 [Clostridia bacterium]|nr:hypothetical protein [Clostridia bacterium]
MAERRMLSKKIVFTDRFTNMSTKAMLLYTFMVMHADDDGFVDNTRDICRTVRAQKKHIIELLEREYILFFPSGIAVICHWKLSNQIAPSKKKPTIYTKELSMLVVREDVYRPNKEFLAMLHQNEPA